MAKSLIMVLTLIGLALQVVPLILGVRALRREHVAAARVMEKTRGPEQEWPERTSTYKDGLFMREHVVDVLLSHSYRQARAGLWALVLGAVLQAAAGLMGMYAMP